MKKNYDHEKELAAMRKRWGKQRKGLPAIQTNPHAFKSMTQGMGDNAHSSTAAPKKKGIEPAMRLEVLPLIERQYIDLCLPLTMHAAEQFKRLISPKLQAFPKSWPFSDKVLVLLEPAFYDQVKNYHCHNGLGMVDMFDELQVEILDKRLAKGLAVLLEKN